MKHKSIILLGFLTIGIAMSATDARGIIVTVAEDDASNYGAWVDDGTVDGNGMATESHGIGLDDWHFRSLPGVGGAAGMFLASGGGDLNNIQTGGGAGNAWGTYANNGGGGSGFQTSVAFRGFGFNGTNYDNSLQPAGGIFRVSMENGFISSTDAPPSVNTVGFTLRHLNEFGSATDYNTNSRFEFAFRGGDTNYVIFDNDSPPTGTDTGIPFTTNGVDVEIQLTSGDTYIFRAFDSASPTTQLGTTITGTFSGASGSSIDSVALYNRNSESANVYFNSIRIQKLVPEPATLMLVSLGMLAFHTSRRHRHRPGTR